jgi:hypothetical protein
VDWLLSLARCEEYLGLSKQIKKMKGHLLLAKRARENDDWTLALGEANAASEAGADLSPWVNE